jgi:proteic killer suppression protein
VIRSFAAAEAEDIFNGIGSRKLPRDIQITARRKLLYLHEAENLQDLLAPPGNHLGKLSGKRSGQYSIRINDQWRICFKWYQGWAMEVEIIDYHH